MINKIQNKNSNPICISQKSIKLNPTLKIVCAIEPAMLACYICRKYCLRLPKKIKKLKIKN
jgi:hypothetical protein